jgi:hypothetical protein
LSPPQACDSVVTPIGVPAKFDEILDAHQAENQALFRATQKNLFTSFTREINQAVTVSPQYLKDKVREFNDRLWQVTGYFFTDKDGCTLDDKTRTLQVGITSAKVFTGTRLGRRKYSMTCRALPKSGWLTPASRLAQNIVGKIFWQGIPDGGEITVGTDLEPWRPAFQ